MSGILEQYRENRRILYGTDAYASDQFISDVHSVFESEPRNENKVLLARILIKSGYEDSFSVLKAIFTPENYDTIVHELYFSLNYFVNERKEKVSVLL